MLYCRKICLSVSFVLVCILAGSAIAQENYFWTNASGDGMWNRDTEPYNWEYAPSWNPDDPAARIPSGPPGHTSGDVFISGNPTTRATPLVIPAGYTADCTYFEQYGTIFGPEWGLHLDIYGSLTYKWYLILAQALEGLIDPNNPDNDPNRSVVNMYSGSRIHGTEDSPGTDKTRAEGIAIGTNWWDPLPYVTMNMYEGSEVLLNWVWIGGHLNMYGGTFDVLTGVNMGIGTPENVPDELISVDIHAGRLILPQNFTNSVEDWIDRGILKAYGMTPGLERGSDIIIDTASIPGRTLVTAIPPNPPEASLPYPVDNTSEMRIDPTLKWRPGKNVAEHEVYIGTDANDINDVNGVNLASYPNVTYEKLSSETYTPAALDFNTRYYWRVDEVNEAHPDKLWKGNVWSFTTGRFSVVDDFEQYTDERPNRIFETWRDKFKITDAQGYTVDEGNGTGMTVGVEEAPYGPERSIVNITTGSRQSLPLTFDNNTASPYFSETDRTFEPAENFAVRDGLTHESLRLWFRGQMESPNGFTRNGSTYTVVGSGYDIWLNRDEFHYVYLPLRGDGSITVRVDSIEDTGEWAKAGVMIRETMDADSTNVTLDVTPANRVEFIYRLTTGELSEVTRIEEPNTFTLPHWLRLTRTGDIFHGEHSPDGDAWEDINDLTTVYLPMSTDVYIGLAVTSWANYATTCEGVITLVEMTGPQDTAFSTSMDIGMPFNDPAPLYIALSDGLRTVTVDHPDGTSAILSESWQEWKIPLSEFTNKYVDVTQIKKMIIGIGDEQPDGEGKLYVDDIRLYPVD